MNAVTPIGRRRRDFQALWAASAVSNLGDEIRLAALPLLALELTDDARLISGVAAMSFLPWIVIGPFAGALVDRKDRRTLMLLGQTMRGVAVIVLAVAVSMGWANVALVYAVAIVVAAGETVVDSASQAAIPHLVADEQFERANGLVQNAINHNQAGGWLSVDVTSDAGIVTLRVANGGNEVDETELQMLFGRFQRGRTAEQRHGYGLGLAIVDTVARAHDAMVTATPIAQGGLDVRISLRGDTQPGAADQ